MSTGVLALDQGSHASRACIFDESGDVCGSASVPVATRQPAPLHVEHDAEELAGSLQSAAESALRAAREHHPRLELAAAGLAVQRSTIVCCSRVDGSALSPALSWQDRRNAPWVEGLAPQAERIRELTGLPLSPHYGASKFRWCLERLPAVARAAQSGELLAAPLASYLSRRLDRHWQGAPIGVDAANAGRTQLFDTRKLDWSEELLELFSIRRAWLPICVSTAGAWGTLGLADLEVELRAVTGDQSAVPYALGAADPGTVYVNLGTGAFIQRPLHSRPESPAPLLGSVLSRDERGALFSLEGTVNGAGSAVSWFCTEEPCAEADLWPALEALPDAVSPPVFVNGIGGLGSPWWRVQQPSRFVGDAVVGSAHPPTSSATLLRFAGLVESIAFMIAVNAELLARQAGSPRRVVLAGGISRSRWLGRRLAALLQLPVEVIDAEASARGVAQLASPASAANWPKVALHCHLPHHNAQLQARFRQFTELMEKG